jgi:hypothetical protein
MTKIYKCLDYILVQCNRKKKSVRKEMFKFIQSVHDITNDDLVRVKINLIVMHIMIHNTTYLSVLYEMFLPFYYYASIQSNYKVHNIYYEQYSVQNIYDDFKDEDIFDDEFESIIFHIVEADD